MDICRGFSATRWRDELQQKLTGIDEGAWIRAIEVFERRLRERFLRPIEIMLETDKSPNGDAPIVPGFAIMALCCLLIDTLQSFYTGGRTNEATTRAFKDFFKNSKHFRNDFRTSDMCGDFSENVRNALLHEAETRSGWRIEKSLPPNSIVTGKKGNYILNRTNFYKALKGEFEDYLLRLRKPTQTDLRIKFLAKMNAIANTAPPIE